MKILLLGASLLVATSVFAQQPAEPPVGPPPGATLPPTTPGQQNPGQMPPDTHAPAAQTLPSVKVQQQIESRIADEPALAGTDISVRVDNHSIVLSGTVDTEQQHQLALRAAESVAGDRPIDDKIQIRGKA